MKESYIRFMAPVIPQTADQLFKIIDNRIKNGVGRLHLLLSSPGGSVFHGLSLYNFLKGAPIEIYTYNFGSVDSIGVVMFCAGNKRFCVPHARFLIHGVSINFNGNHSLDEKGLEEKLKGLRIDYLNIAKVIADTTGRKTDQVEGDMNSRTTLNPQEAREYGLVHEIKSELFPAGADIAVVGEISPESTPAPLIQQIPMQMLQQPKGAPQFSQQNIHMTEPDVISFTVAEGILNGTYFDY